MRRSAQNHTTSEKELLSQGDDMDVLVPASLALNILCGQKCSSDVRLLIRTALFRGVFGTDSGYSAAWGSHYHEISTVASCNVSGRPFCYNPTSMYVEIHLGDIVRLRKKHPCGSLDWEVVRLGVDVGLICQVCGRKVLLPRGTFNKRYKSTVSVSQLEE